MPQAFCRFSAVHGGIFVLRQPVNGIAVNSTANGRLFLFTTAGSVLCYVHLLPFLLLFHEEKAEVRGIISEGLLFKAHNVIVPPRYAPHLARPRSNAYVARGVFVIHGRDSK